MHAAEESHEGIERRVISAISAALSGPVLTQYEGWVLAQLDPRDGSSGKLRVGVRFLQSQPDRTLGATASVRIADGEKASTAEFELELIVGIGRFSSARATATVPTRGNSMTFYLEAPAAMGDDKAWLQVFQRNKLVQVVGLNNASTQHAAE